MGCSKERLESTTQFGDGAVHRSFSYLIEVQPPARFVRSSSPGEPILLPSRKNRRGLRPRPPIKLCQEAERSPCWSAFRLARAFPLGVRGPVDLRAFRRRASSSWGCQATTLEQTHQTTSLPGPGGGAGGQTKRSLKITSEILSQI